MRQPPAAEPTTRRLGVEGPAVEGFRREVRAFLSASEAAGLACPAFGAIMPPSFFERASAWQRLCFDNGFAGIDWEVDYGGRGLSGAHQQVRYEECSHAGIAPYMNFQGILLAGGAVRKFGTKAQKQRYLRATLCADIVWCQLFGEPNAGSDLVSLRTRAVPSGDGWLVTGQKVWSSTAPSTPSCWRGPTRTSRAIEGSRSFSSIWPAAASRSARWFR